MRSADVYGTRLSKVNRGRQLGLSPAEPSASRGSAPATTLVLCHDDKLVELFTGLRQKQRQDSDLIELVFPNNFRAAGMPVYVCYLLKTLALLSSWVFFVL